MTEDIAHLMLAFGYIDEQAGPLVIARAEIELGNGDTMSIAAGGGLITSSPSAAPFTHYEVILDHEPARFWRRFTDDDQLLYSNVPQLPVAHHVIRHGGVREMAFTTSFVEVAAPKLRVRLPITSIDELAQALTDITGVSVSKDVLTW